MNHIELLSTYDGECSNDHTIHIYYYTERNVPVVDKWKKTNRDNQRKWNYVGSGMYWKCRDGWDCSRIDNTILYVYYTQDNLSMVDKWKKINRDNRWELNCVGTAKR